MAPLAEIPMLEGALVRLEPLGLDHAQDLAVAAEEDRSSYGFTSVPRAWEVGEYLTAHFERRATGTLAPFALVRRNDERAVGCTAFWDPRSWGPGTSEQSASDLYAVEVGWTWLGSSAQRTGINIEAKLLLFNYAFTTLRVARVDLKTDARNDRSRRAIEALGARFEGVLRSWSPSHAPGEGGLLRDSAMFSVLAGEWPDVEARLLSRLGAVRSAGGKPGGRTLGEG